MKIYRLQEIFDKESFFFVEKHSAAIEFQLESVKQGKFYRIDLIDDIAYYLTKAETQIADLQQLVKSLYASMRLAGIREFPAELVELMPELEFTDDEEV